MADVQITRKQIVQIDNVGKNDYGDLTFKDMDSKEYKVNQARKKYFEKIIVPGATVELSFATYMDKEYVYSAVKTTPISASATPVAQSNPTKQEKPPESHPSVPHEVKTAIDDKRASIEKQVSLKAAVEFNTGKNVRIEIVIKDAQKCYEWLRKESN